MTNGIRASNCRQECQCSVIHHSIFVCSGGSGLDIIFGVFGVFGRFVLLNDVKELLSSVL